MLNKGRFEQKWVFFFKIKVIYMIMYEFLFSLKAFVHCKTISFFDFDGCFFHNFCGMLSPTNHLPKLFVKPFSYIVWSFNLDIANECKLQVFTVWNQNDMHFKTLHPQTIPTHLYGTRVDLAVLSRTQVHKSHFSQSFMQLYSYNLVKSYVNTVSEYPINSLNLENNDVLQAS